MAIGRPLATRLAYIVMAYIVMAIDRPPAARLAYMVMAYIEFWP